MSLLEAVRSALFGHYGERPAQPPHDAGDRDRRRGRDRHGGDRVGARNLVDRQIRARREPRRRRSRQRHAGRRAARRRRGFDPHRRGRRRDPAGRSTASWRRHPSSAGRSMWCLAPTTGARPAMPSTDWFDAREWDVETGRTFDPEEIRRGEIVVILGRTVARSLFGDGDPLDQTIRVRNVPFKVIGVMAPKGQSAFGTDQSDVIFVPLDAGRRRGHRPQLRQGPFRLVDLREVRRRGGHRARHRAHLRAAAPASSPAGSGRSRSAIEPKSPTRRPPPPARTRCCSRRSPPCRSSWAASGS